MSEFLPTFLPPALIDEIAAMHAGPARGYHGWPHPLALLRLHHETVDSFDDPDAVAAAILLHDAIYDPRRTDNETRSATLAIEILTPHLPEARVARVRRLIEATASHTIAADTPTDEIADMKLFLDMDLSILGAPEADFDAYESGVRHEYRHIEGADFAAGRAAILEKFLARPHLYFTDWGRARFEAKARKNLARSLKSLRS